MLPLPFSLHCSIVSFSDKRKLVHLMQCGQFPALNVNLDAIQKNAEVLCELCGQNGIAVAGVIKFSDGDLQIARAYHEGGCAQIGVSRAKHLRPLKEACPEIETLLTRSPVRADMELCARYADLSLHSDPDVLRALNDEASKWGRCPGIILMLDVGDLREGVDNIPELLELAGLCEALPNLRLRGLGTNLACMNGVLPTEENLSFLVEAAEAVEASIGRRLDIISGGSSINLLLLRGGINKMPGRINHLRLGGSIANPMNIRLNRGLSFPGLREDTMSLTAEIVEIHEKASAPKAESTKNWAGEAVVREDKGRRTRAILALGSQDVGDACSLLPTDEGLELVGCSSDHCIVDVSDSEKVWRSGDTMSFKLRYANMLYAFTGSHVAVKYSRDR